MRVGTLHAGNLNADSLCLLPKTQALLANKAQGNKINDTAITGAQLTPNVHLSVCLSIAVVNPAQDVQCNTAGFARS